MKNKNFFILLSFVLVVIFLYTIRSPSHSQSSNRYVHQHFYQKYSPSSSSYRVMIVADMDKESKFEVGWRSFALYGNLHRDSSGSYSITWETEKRVISSQFNEGGRSMELSDLCNFNDKLYSFDDRTGMVIVIDDEIAYPVGLLMDGSGRINKGFKGEWCTVKDDKLFIGGMGKEWTDEEGNYVNDNPLWVKVLDHTNSILHINWSVEYHKLRSITETLSPGYLLHEAVTWIPSSSSWLFLPRRVSKEKYNAVQDEYRCSNLGISVNKDFSDLHVVNDIGVLSKTRGFSSVKYVPYRENEIVVLKTEEVNQTTSYIMVYDLNTKKVLLPETPIPGNIKFEGIEFL